jgi:hypothetical protein
MRDTMKHLGDSLARPFRVQLGSRPLGIWLSWLGIVYAATAQKDRVFMLMADPIGGFRTYSDAVVNGPAIVAAVILLALRQRTAQIFGGIACANLVVHTIFHADLLGTCVGILGFAGLIANSDYFKKRAPVEA